MPPATLHLLQGFLSLLRFVDLITSPLGLAIILWVWFYLVLPYDTALALWSMALVPLVSFNKAGLE